MTSQRIGTIKKELLQIRGQICETCKNSLWNNIPIPIEIHHMDGIRQNNSPDNLKLLCPNCHAQTKNYCSKNSKKKPQRVSDLTVLNTIPKCQSITEVLKVLGLSYYGQGHTRIKNLIAIHGISLAPRQFSELEVESRLASRKVTRPSSDRLKALVWSKSSSQVAKELGVSDSAIVKWCNFYGIEKPPRGYWRKVTTGTI